MPHKPAAFSISSLGKVLGKQLRLGLSDFGEVPLNGFGDAGMKRASRLTQQCAIGGFLQQGVLEHWAWRLPLIVTAPLKLRQEHFVLDGETVLGPDGVSDFAALHSGRHDERAQLHTFDMLAGYGKDQRQLPLSLRKTAR